MKGILLSVFSIAIFLNVAALAQQETAQIASDAIIVKFKPNTHSASKRLLAYRSESDMKELVSDLGLFVFKASSTAKSRKSLQTQLAEIRQNPDVEYAQLNHKVTKREAVKNVPNDSRFGEQWSMNSSLNGAHIDAEMAWSLGTGGTDALGNDVVVAVVDGGADISHPDLKENIWINKNEVPNDHIDNDNNGYIDDVNGWNVFDGNGTIPADEHATHVAGIIGARGNNGSGIVGINWKVKVMTVAGSSGDTAEITKAYGYVIAMKKLWISSGGKKGANIVSTNSSFGVDYANCASGDYPVWNDLYDQMGKLGILSAVAGPNLGIDVDVKGDVPSGCTAEGIVSVTNVQSNGNIHSQAGYGKKSIDIAAPGTDILSTVPGASYAKMTGTSMATPHIAGAIAFMMSVATPAFIQQYKEDPATAAQELKARLLSSVTKTAQFQTKTVSGGRLNLYQAASVMSQFTPARMSTMAEAGSH